MTRFMQPSFSVAAPGTQEYRDNWDAIFGKKDAGAAAETVFIGGVVAAAYTEDSDIPAGTFDQIKADIETIYKVGELPTVFPTDDALASAKLTVGGTEVVLDGVAIVDACNEFTAELVRAALQFFLDQAIRPTSDIRAQVEEFRRVMGQPVRDVPQVPPMEEVSLGLRLITEEFEELLSACGATGFAHAVEDDEYFTETIDRGIANMMKGYCAGVDIVEVADALADLDYVIEGLRLAFGINGKPIADEVHRSNMAKVWPDGSVRRREDGKILKPDGWTAPDIAGVLGRQQGG